VGRVSPVQKKERDERVDGKKKGRRELHEQRKEKGKGAETSTRFLAGLVE